MKWPYLSAAACLAVALALAGCGKTERSYRYESPASPVELVIDPVGAEPAAERRVNEVYLLGAAPPAPPDQSSSPPRDKVEVGRFTGLWELASIGWIDAHTVVVCPLAAVAAVRTSVSILVTETERRTVRIIPDCRLSASGAGPITPARSGSGS